MKNVNQGIPFLCLLVFCFSCMAIKAQKREYYEIKVYHVKTNDQVKQVDLFLTCAMRGDKHSAGTGPLVLPGHWFLHDTL